MLLVPDVLMINSRCLIETETGNALQYGDLNEFILFATLLPGVLILTAMILLQ